MVPIRSPSKGINAKIQRRRGASWLRSSEPYAESSRSNPAASRRRHYGGPLDLDTPRWADLDGPSLATAAAALQLLPENIPCLTRAQRLAAIGAALPARPGVRPLSPSRLRAVLKDPLISGEDVRRQEDPYDDVYVEEVAFHGGPRLVLQGLTNHSAHTVRILLQAIFNPADAALPAGYRRQASLLTASVLTLSHLMCSKAGLRRGSTMTLAQRRDPFVPGLLRLAELQTAATFTSDDLSGLLPAGAMHALEGWITEAGAHRVNFDQAVTDYGLILRPLLRHGADLIVASPGELMSALRHHLIVMAASYGCRDVLADAFRRTAAAVTSELLSQVEAVPRGPAERAADPLVLRQVFDGKAGTIIDVGLMSDDLSGYDPADPFGQWNIPNAGKPLQDCLDPPGPPGEDDERTLRLAVTDDLARSQIIALESPRRQGPLLSVPLDELQVMVDLDADDPLFLWRYARANEDLHERSRVLTWSVLDTHSIYRDNDHSFYLSDDPPPTMVTIEVGSGASLRAQAQRRHDRHHIQRPDRPTYVEVMSVYGTETAPIYFCHPRYGLVALAVELPGATAWVLHPAERSEAVRGFLFTVLEAVAYWIWQLELAQPGLAARAADRGRLLKVVVTPDDSARWNQVLTGQSPERPDDAPDDGSTAAASWVAVNAGSPGKIDVTVLADQARVLLSGTNLADRQLVAALARVFAPSDQPGPVDVITRQVAPAGPKRMIHIVRSSDVLLMPTDIPERFVQPAVTATILDDLGQWLTSQGLGTGPVPSAERTKVLNQAVDHHYQQLAQTVADLSPDGLMAFFVAQDEAVLQDSATRAQRLPSQLACFGPGSLRAQDLRTQEGKSVQAAVASRFLIEYIAATPPGGNTPVNLMIYDELLAMAAELISRATLSDAIRYGFSKVELSMLPSGRLGVSIGDRYAAGTEAAAAAEAEARHTLALEPLAPGMSQTRARTKYPATDEATRARVDEAMRAEFGLTLTQVVTGLSELAVLSTGRRSDPCTEPVSQVRSRLQDLPGWDEGIAEAFLARLALRARPEFLSPGPDVYPWRYSRDLSYIRRPLIETAGPAGQPLLMWGSRRTWFAARYWTELIFAGRIKGTTQAMKTLMGTIRQAENKAFERKVETTLGQSGMPITAATVKRICGRRLLSTDGADLGDIDAIALNPASKTIIVAEAKDFELARTPAEVANEAEELLTGDNSAACKHSRRADWVRGNLTLVLRHFGAEGNAAGWQVLPVIVTSRNLLSPRVIQTQIPVIALADLPSWTGQQNGLRRRRRKR